jgi:hypothetical protein
MHSNCVAVHCEHWRPQISAGPPAPGEGPGGALTVDLVGALSDFDNIAVRIADVAADLAVLGDRRREELGPSTFP